MDCPTGYVKTSLQRKLIKRLGRLTYYKYIYIFNFTDDIGAVFQWFDLGLFLGVGKPVAASYCVYCSLSHVIYVTLLFQTGKTPFYALWKTIVQRKYTTLILANINSRLHGKLKKNELPDIAPV